MKFIADENIPLEAIIALRRSKIDIASLSELNPGLEDEGALSIANKESRVLITFDLDFWELVFRHKIKSRGVILLRIHPQDTEYIISILLKTLSKNIDFENSFCVVEVGRIRAIPLNK